MRWAANAAPDARFIVTAACDTPFFPLDLVKRLLGSTDGANPCIALAASGGQIHPVFGLWPIAFAEDLALSLEKGTRKVLHWTDRHPHCIVEFAFTDSVGTVSTHFNANTPEDLAEAERLLTEGANIVTAPLFGVVGWKNSGKTTLMVKLIAAFIARRLNISAVKHAHHAFDIDHEGATPTVTGRQAPRPSPFPHARGSPL